MFQIFTQGGEKMKKGTFFTRKTTIEFLLILSFAIGSSVYICSLNDFIEPFIDKQFVNLLCLILIFALLMKMISLGDIQYVTSKSLIPAFIQITYEFRYPLLVVLVFAFAFHSFGKPASLVDVMVEYHQKQTEERVLTIYNKGTNTVYDQENRRYFIYNKNFTFKTENTYKITYLKSSNIIVDAQGPLNIEPIKKVDKIVITDAQIKKEKATIKWKPFIFNGKKVEKYRIRTFVKKPDGELMRSGSQIVVEDGKNSVEVLNILPNREYQFLIEPQLEDAFSEKHGAKTNFLQMKE
jgi:hypothetical protein